MSRDGIVDLQPAAVAGIDEAGRGPLAGPVVAAAVVLGKSLPIGLQDSKQTTEKQRNLLFEDILGTAEAVGIGIASVEEIETLNILQATLVAMERAVDDLPVYPRSVLVDGKHCPSVRCLATTIVGGDVCVPAISAASIVAKVTRDRIMLVIDELYPEYGFSKHKGYPTTAHLEALRCHGVSDVHRRTFAPVRRCLHGAVES